MSYLNKNAVAACSVELEVCMGSHANGQYYFFVEEKVKFQTCRSSWSVFQLF